MPIDTTGDSGSGFLTSSAGLLVLAVLVVLAVAMPTFRSTLADHIGQFRSYFFGHTDTPDLDESPEAGQTSETAAGLAHQNGTGADTGESEAAGSSSQRASDAEQFDFDLEVFANLFDGHEPTSS